MLEDYRAGLREDVAVDAADHLAGRKVRRPTLVVWELRDDAEELYRDLLPIWREWADDVRTAAIDSGHHMAEEAPDELAATLRAFIAERPHELPLAR
jgi:haloacetate dehalogenase